ncbi:hypothetical protein Tsubulata_045104 [Turnera subulata]|uniref:Uncharacterized protein n=1 Tax=Turnera subulata TaxID=218843 RepID=A0A9Q0J151_9ROSI|nr:hypothetical protein Tsubulata_045104 [Turnera subulata]
MPSSAVVAVCPTWGDKSSTSHQAAPTSLQEPPSSHLRQLSFEAIRSRLRSPDLNITWRRPFCVNFVTRSARWGDLGPRSSVPTHGSRRSGPLAAARKRSSPLAAAVRRSCYLFTTRYIPAFLVLVSLPSYS